MSEPLPLKVVQLGHRYGDTEIFCDVSLSVSPGSLVAVLGASGSGKSTLLRAVAGFVVPTSGTISIGGVDVVRDGRELVAAEHRRVGMVFQDYALFPTMTVRQNIEFGIHRDPQRSQRSSELLELVGLVEFGDREPASLSGGQQQRVALARALAPRPRLLLLDEPFANLDAALREEMGLEVRRILGAEGVSGLLVTHDRSEALGLADEVAVLGCVNGGGSARLLQTASPSQIYARPVSKAVALLTGRAMFVSGEVGDGRLHSPVGELLVSGMESGANTAMVRPEQLVFTEEAGGDCRVRARRFKGAAFELRVETPAGVLVMDCVAADAPEVGAIGRVAVNGACALVSA